MDWVWILPFCSLVVGDWVSLRKRYIITATMQLSTASIKNNPTKDFDATKPAMVGPTNQSILLTTREIPKPSERFESGSRSAMMAFWAGVDTAPMKPTSTERGYMSGRL